VIETVTGTWHMTGRSRWIAVTRSSDEKPVRLARIKQNRYSWKLTSVPTSLDDWVWAQSFKQHQFSGGSNSESWYLVQRWDFLEWLWLDYLTRVETSQIGFSLCMAPRIKRDLFRGPMTAEAWKHLRKCLSGWLHLDYREEHCTNSIYIYIVKMNF
jgi:hypothetical protein